MQTERTKLRVEEILERARERSMRIAAAHALRGEALGPQALTVRPVLLAEGDSWFDYPGTDVLAELEDGFGYEIASVSHGGDTLESMAYAPRQLDGFNRRAEKLAKAGKVPKAVLLSAGGNDIAGTEFPLLLNHQASGMPTLSESIVRGLIDERLREAYRDLIRLVGGICQAQFGNSRIPVVVHGYGYPVPDGRGFLGGWWLLPGPWLKPGFDQKGYGPMDLFLEENTRVMVTLIDRFNQMLTALSADPDFSHVRHVNLRQALANDAGYATDWSNELHPSDRGFAAVARLFHTTIGNL
jgi:hypothetical protein